MDNVPDAAFDFEFFVLLGKGQFHDWLTWLGDDWEGWTVVVAGSYVERWGDLPPGHCVRVEFPDGSTRIGRVDRLRVTREGCPAEILAWRPLGSPHLEQVIRAGNYTNTGQIKDILRGANLVVESRPRGGQAGTPRSPKVRRWIERVNEVGAETALAEFKAEVSHERGDWQQEYQWWARRVRPKVR